MEAKQLRDVAWTLDALSKLTRALYEPIARGATMNAGEVTVTCELTKNGEPMSPRDAQHLLDWVASREMQESLEAWADEMDSTDG